VKTALEIAQTETAIQNRIEVWLCDIGSGHTTRVSGDVEYDGSGALVPM